DFDLILGFARYDEGNFGFEKLSYGMSYWENEGSREEPKWVEKKKAVTNNDASSNLRVSHYCDPVLIFDNYDFGDYLSPPVGYHPHYREGLPTRVIMFQSTGSSAFYGTLQYFKAQYEHGTSLLAATYPEAKRIDINLLYRSSPTMVNYGFHVFETWDNEEELREWTLSMSTADLDEDGKNEVIVGDFNNNIYVFEHLTNNTYKRAFRSFDINRTIQTTESPYAWEQFEGISGKFNRTLFDHIQYLLANDIDLDQDGLQEFIAATDDMIFVFEATRSPTGRIRDDTYRLETTIDLLNVETLFKLPQDDFKITAMTTGEDLSHDGRKELLIAVSSALLIFEINDDYSYEEIFYGDSYLTKGIYDTPGSYRWQPQYLINALLVDDLDQDGFTDLVIAGIDRSIARPLWAGFITILEWQGHMFYHLADNDDFKGTVQYGNHIFDLTVGDSDYDELKELIVGHANGIDIYEFTGDNQLALRERITSNPNYPYLTTTYWRPPTGSFDVDKDALRVNTTTIFMAYSYNYDIYLASSDDDGISWTDLGKVTSTRRSSRQTFDTRHPVLGKSPNGDIWLVYELITLSGMYRTTLYFQVSSDGGTTWSIPYSISQSPDWPSTTFSFSPSLYQVQGAASSVIGLAYNYPAGDNNKAELVHLNSVGMTVSTPIVYPWVNGTKLDDHFTVASLDVTYITKKSWDTELYGLVFSGYVNIEELSLDYDLFFGTITINRTDLTYSFTRPTRITNTGLSSFYPSIITEIHTGNLVITYEEPTLKPFGGLWAIWSSDEGLTWNGPYDMSLPLGLDPTYVMMIDLYGTVKPIAQQSGESYVVGYHSIADGTLITDKINHFEARRPTLVPGNDSGFSMIYSVYFKKDSATREVFATAINPWSNFTWYKIGKVMDLSVGDSDRDGRHEILATSGKQAVLL
ncbi:MAG: exo-alpha-sialidase, partial [Candidatus Hodarchaeota archaeon]